MAIGNEWSMKVALPPVSFGVGRPVREEMVADVNEALDEDVKYEMPTNYLRGEGDSKFAATRQCSVLFSAADRSARQLQRIGRNIPRKYERDIHTLNLLCEGSRS